MYSLEMINKKRLIDNFRLLAEIPSPSGKEDVICEFLMEKLSQAGVYVQKDDYGNIIGTRPGKGTPLILCAHMDTVEIGERNEIKTILTEKGTITSDGTTILGADNKDYLAAIIEALTIISSRELITRSLEIVITREEENISAGAKNLNYSLLEGKECLISDLADTYGTIIRSAPFCFKFDIKVEGKKVHTKEADQGTSAIFIACDLITKMPLGKVDNLTSVNCSYIIGGLNGVIDNENKKVTGLINEARNTVPDICFIHGEIRGAKLQVVQDNLKIIESLVNNISTVFKNSNAKISIIKLADGYYFDDTFFDTNPLALKIIGIFNDQKVSLQLIDAVGGSDANILIGNEINTLVISSAHRDNHRNTEYLIIEDLIKLTDLLLRTVTI